MSARRVVTAYAAPSAAVGFSLVELLVSLFLMALLTGAVMALYLDSRRHHLITDQSARIQENGRYAIALLSGELAMAGFYGTALPTDPLPEQSVGSDCNAGNWALSSANALDHVNDYAGAAAPVTSTGVSLDCLEPPAILANTDLLVVKRTAAQPTVQGGILTEDATASAVVSWFLRTSAGTAATWLQRSTQALADAQPHDPTHTYWKANAKVFFLRPYAVTPGDDIPALCAQMLAGDGMTARCYVEGVENMQVEFGIDMDGDSAVDLYRQNPTAQQLKQSLTARVHLLLRSVLPLPGYTDSRSYQLGSQFIQPRGDAYKRRVFSAMVRLRNSPASTLGSGD